MLSVFLNQLSYGCENLEHMIRRQKIEIDRLASVIDMLNTFSNMRQLRERLKKEKEELERQNGILYDMAVALDRIVISYQKAENRIIENVDGNTRIHKAFTLQSVDMFSYVDDKIPIKTE